MARTPETPQMVEHGGRWYASEEEYRAAVAHADSFPAWLHNRCDNADHLRNFLNESHGNVEIMGHRNEDIQQLLRTKKVKMSEEFGGAEVRWCRACRSNDSDMIAEEPENTGEPMPNQPPMTSVEYVRERGCVCPVCRRNGGLVGEGVEIDNGEAAQEVNCPECHSTWIDRYVLTGYTIVTNGTTPQAKDDLRSDDPQENA